MSIPPVIPFIVSVARGALAFNTLTGKPILKIHPATGVARVGDAPADFFIGPERPLAGNTGADAGVGSAVPSFRAGGKIKRQAARFRIFHYPAVGVPEEVNLDHPAVAEIEWTVHLANRKAAFFQFEGQRGAAGPYAAGAPDRRNKSIAAATREAKLVIDPGPRSIKGVKAGPVKFDTGSGNFPKDAAGAPVIDYLGELQTDDKGRLLVLGGRGKSASSNALPASALQMTELRAGGFAGPNVGATRPPAPLLDYANNDTWFDDVSDGPVTAKVKLKSGKTIVVQSPGWVLVGPPDFAPDIRNVISLYDTMLDVAIRELPLPPVPFQTAFDRLELDELKKSLAGTPGFQPEWFVDIEPTILAGFQARFVHQAVQSSHVTLTLAQLKSPAAADKPIRESVFNFLRPPAGNTTYSGPGSMPKLFGDNYFTALDPKRVAAVTRVQHHVLSLWKDGNFLVAGVGGPSPLFTPAGLDRAPLESCVGGAFFPGIECSWLVRDKRVYAEPYRIKHGASVGPLTVGPGFFSQQMALPWQADFIDCAKEIGSLGVFYGWWPAQRPDDVYLSAADAAAERTMVEWARNVPAPPGSPRGATHAAMVAKWNRLGFVVSAVVAGKKVFFEQDRTLP
jgi:hypothetical protein